MRQQLVPFGCTLLELLFRFRRLKWIAELSLGGDLLGRARGIGCRHLDELSATDNAVGLLDLQIGKASHCLRCSCALRSLIEIAAITLRRAFKTVGDIHLFNVRRNCFEFSERALFIGSCTAKGSDRGERDYDDSPVHCASSIRAWACVARS